MNSSSKPALPWWRKITLQQSRQYKGWRVGKEPPRFLLTTDPPGIYCTCQRQSEAPHQAVKERQGPTCSHFQNKRNSPEEVSKTKLLMEFLSSWGRPRLACRSPGCVDSPFGKWAKSHSVKHWFPREEKTAVSMLMNRSVSLSVERSLTGSNKRFWISG